MSPPDGPALYLQALTHSSWSHENPLPSGGRPPHYERLEFLGDAVLELCVRELLLTRFPHAAEGDLTPAKQQLVKNEALPAIADRLGVLEGARLGNSMKRQVEAGGGQALKADLVEALLGALYLHRGFGAARVVVRGWFGDAALRRAKATHHPKWALQMHLEQQGRSIQSVAFERRESSGPDHARVFRVRLTIDGEEWCEGEGSSWKKAEVAAAEQALVRLGDASTLPSLE